MQAGTAAKQDSADIDAVMTALDAGDTERASTLARAALDRGEMHPLLLNLRAWWHERNGRLPQALIDLGHAHTRAPEDVPVLNALGLCLERAGRMREAADAFDKAATLAPGFVPAQMNSGRLQEALGNFDGARDSYQRALKLGHNAHADLAALASRRADWKMARAHAQQALAISPGVLSAEYVLAAAEIAERDTATAKGRLNRLLKNAELAAADRATVLSLLGDALDAEGDFPAAFAAYDAGNSARRETLASRDGDAAADRLGIHLERLSQYFGHLPADTFAPAEAPEFDNEDAPEQHVFLLGFARSGTTLLEEALARHAAVETTQEKDGLDEAVAGLFVNEPAFNRLVALSGGGLARYRRAYWSRLASFGIRTKSGCLIDKQPYNTIRLPLIAKLFPAAKILFCLRDPRDVVLSCFRRRFVANDSNRQLLTLDGAARFYDSVMRLAGIYRAKIPLELFEVRHEDLVADFEGETKRICAHIGIPWTPEITHVGGSGRSVVTPTAVQLAGGLNTRGVGHWRNYRSELAPVLPILAPWAERFGYPKD